MSRRPDRPSLGHRWVTTRAVFDKDWNLLEEEGYWYLGPWALLHPNPGFDQAAYRWRLDDNNEVSATDLTPDSTTQDFDVTAGNVDRRLRFLLQEAGGAAINNVDFELTFQIDGGGYNQITGATTGCIFYDSSLADGSDTTEQMAGSGTFQGTNAGQSDDGAAGGGALDMAANEDVEVEFSVRFVSADFTGGESVDFRVTRDGGTLLTDDAAGAYSVTANATITKSSDANVNAEVATIALTGETATIASADNVSAATASIALTGETATVASADNVDAAAATIALTAETATVTHPVDIAANAATMALTGQTATVTFGANVDANAASIALTGETATVASADNVDANTATVALTGETATVASADNVPANAATVALTGETATLTFDSNVDASAASMTLTGQTATIAFDSNVDANAAAIALTGETAGVAVSGAAEINANAATLTLVAQPATITYTGTAEEVETATGGYLTPREQQIIAAQNEDELLIKFVSEFLERVA